MAGKRVLQVLIAEVDRVAWTNRQRFWIRVNLSLENSGGGASLGGGQRAGFAIVDLHLDLDAVLGPGGVHIEIGDLDGDAFAGVDAQELLADLIDGAVASPDEIVRDRQDPSVVVSGGERLADGAIALQSACGDCVDVGSGDAVARGDLEDVIACQSEQVGPGGDVGLPLAADLDVAHHNRFPLVFIEGESQVAELGGRNREADCTCLLRAIHCDRGNGLVVCDFEIGGGEWDLVDARARSGSRGRGRHSACPGRLRRWRDHGARL